MYSQIGYNCDQIIDYNGESFLNWYANHTIAYKELDPGDVIYNTKKVFSYYLQAKNPFEDENIYDLLGRDGVDGITDSWYDLKLWENYE